MSLFEKGDFRKVESEFRIHGLLALQEISKFQEKFKSYDTDTTINSVRDSIVANYLGYDMLNYDKHGFDAKKSNKQAYLEIKQCSIVSKKWSGTWNDTSPDKAICFSDPRLSTAIAVWRSASDLQFIVYGQNEQLGTDIHKSVINRKIGSRSTQVIPLKKFVLTYNFNIICPPGKRREDIYELLVAQDRDYAKLNIDDIKSINQI